MSKMTLSDQSTSPSVPSTGQVSIFIADEVVKSINSAGTVTDYSGENEEWVSLIDTPSAITADGHVKGNSGGTALEFGQGVDTSDSPTFVAILIGLSTPFSDSSGVLTLQNVDVLDATTEATIEDAIDTLANLTSIQSQTVSFSGSLTVEADSTINQDLTTDASPTFAGLTVGGESAVTTADTLDSLTLMLGNGSTSLQAADDAATTANISVSAAFDEMLITPVVNGNSTYGLNDSTGTLKGEFFYDDLSDALGIAGLTDFSITSTASLTVSAQTTLDLLTSTGDIIFTTLISTERMRIDSATGEVTIGGTLTVGGETAVTTTDTLDSLALMVGNGSTSLQAADGAATTANISVNAAFDEILITAAVNGDASYKLLSSASVLKYEAFYEDDNDVMIMFSGVEFSISSNDSLTLSGQTTLDLLTSTGDIIFTTLVSNERMRIASDGSVTIGGTLTVGGEEVSVDGGNIFFSCKDSGKSTTTRFLIPGNADVTATTTSERIWYINRASTIKNLTVGQPIATGNTNLTVYTVMLNGVATVLTVSVTGDSTVAVTDSTNSFAVVVGDEITLQLTRASDIGTKSEFVWATMEQK